MDQNSFRMQSHHGSIRSQIKLLSHAMSLSHRMRALGRFHTFLSLGWQSYQMPVLKDEAIYRGLHNTGKQRNKGNRPSAIHFVLDSFCLCFRMHSPPCSHCSGSRETDPYISIRASLPSGFWLSSVNGDHEQRLGDESEWIRGKETFFESCRYRTW